MKKSTFAIKAIFVSLFLLVIGSHAFSQQTTLRKMQSAIDTYLERYFEANTLIFKYYGNVEITSSNRNSDGSYFLEGTFEHLNLLELRVTKTFRCTIRPVVDDYSVRKFEFYHRATDNTWSWWEIKR